MSDWIALFKFLELNVGNRTSGESESAPERTRNPTNKKTLHELENNQCLNRMMHALATAQVVGENMTLMETAIYSFLYISPRTTPAGRMLERLYCSINSRAQDPELRCLRVLSQFNTTDIETGLSDTMSLVMRCFNVKDNFQRLVENVLRQKKDVVQVVTTKTIRPLLRKPGNRSRAEKNSAEVYGELEHLETCGEFSDNDQFIHPEASLLHLRPTHTTGNMQIPAPLSHRQFEQNL